MAQNDSTGSTRLARQRSTSSDTMIHHSRLSASGQLIVVANRLPVTITSDAGAEGGYRFSVSSGGLASALAGAKKKMDFVVSPLRDQDGTRKPMLTLSTRAVDRLAW